MYTLGNEFLLNGQNYIGEYNIGFDGRYYTGGFFVFGRSIQLERRTPNTTQFKYTNEGINFINNNSKFYNKYKFIKVYSDGTPPTQTDYKNKKMTRYFVYITYSNVVKQVSNSTYNKIEELKSTLYIIDSIVWILSGKPDYVAQENKRKIENSKIKLLYKYITNYMQFYQS